MNLNWRLELPQWIVLVSMVFVSALLAAQLPDRVPMHWDLHGEVNRYGTKAEALFAIPAIALFIYLVMFGAPLLDRRATDLSSFQLPYAAIRFLTLLLLLVVHLAVLLSGVGWKVDIAKVVGTGVGLLFAAIGLLMSKMPPNGMVGIRIPWTMRSDRAWYVTHRVAGWLYALLGIAMIWLGWMPRKWILIAVIGMFIIVHVLLIAIAFVAARRDVA